MNELIKRAIEQQKAAYARMDALSAKAATEGRNSFTAEEKVSFDTALDDYRAAKGMADSLAAQEEAKTAIEGLAEMKSVSLFGGGDEDPKPETKQALGKAANAILKGKWSEGKAFGDYLRKGREGLELKDLKALNSTSDVDGGYLVTQQMASFILTKIRQELLIEQRANVIRTNAASFAIPTFLDENDPAIIAENGTITEVSISDAFGKLILTPSKLALIYGIPMELIEDSAFDLEPYLGDHFGYRFALRKENLYINGSGASQALGLLGVTWAKTYDIAGSTDAIAPEDIVNATFKLAPQYRRRAAWILPTYTLNKIALFRTEEGGIGTGAMLWLPSFIAGQPDTMLGKPIIESVSFGTPASDGDPMLLLGDLSTYIIADRIALSVQRLTELYAATDRIGYKMRLRMDASPSDENAFVRYNRN